MSEDFTAIERAAKELRHEWDSPDLWPRIASDLQTRKPRRNPWLWTAAVAAALTAVLTLSALWFTRKAPAPSTLLLTQQAMQDVDKAEAAYIQSIDRLSKAVAPSLAGLKLPLASSYREKLALLDQAIAELRAEAANNPYHAGLRLQLGEVYREKQLTLQEALRYAAQSPR